MVSIFFKERSCYLTNVFTIHALYKKAMKTNLKFNTLPNDVLLK